MRIRLRIVTVVFALTSAGFLTFTNFKLKKRIDIFHYQRARMAPCRGLSPQDVLKDGNGIMLMETTDRMEPTSLILCSLESAARVYPDRPVVFFMKGLDNITTWEDQMETRKRFPVLSAFHNIYFFPLRMEELLKHTPLQPWFERTIPEKEKYWTLVSSYACRFALMWRYGGMYLDTDVISTHPINLKRFLVPEYPAITSARVYALTNFHPMVWQFMKSFVDNYRGDIWGRQGSGVFTRVVKRWCGVPQFKSTEDTKCLDIDYLHPQRFYPLLRCRLYFKVWDVEPNFINSYGVHLWNLLNKEQKELEPGSSTLVEPLYQKYCSTTYKSLMEKIKSGSEDKSQSQTKL